MQIRIVTLIAFLALPAACSRDYPAEPGTPQFAKVPKAHKYAVVRAATPVYTWSQAERLARRYVDREQRISGGHLVVVTSQLEQELLISLNGQGCWIGLRQVAKSDEPTGNWEWVDGQTLVYDGTAWTPYANWREGEPNDGWGYAGGEDVAALEGDGYWNDMPDDYLMNCFIVEDEQ